MRIGYQGTLGSFSWTAAKKLYPNDELINFLTFKDVTDNVLNGNLDFGIIPVENSYTGEVGMVLDELFHSNVYITQMYNLPIIQNLIGLKEAKISDIKHVYSHEQALMQCSNILKELGVELISFSNTALASQYIKEQNDITKAFEAAHSLKGTLGNMGLTPMYEIIIQIVEPLRDGNIDGIAEKHQLLMEKYNELLAIKESC